MWLTDRQCHGVLQIERVGLTTSASNLAENVRPVAAGEDGVVDDALGTVAAAPRAAVLPLQDPLEGIETYRPLTSVAGLHTIQIDLQYFLKLD